MENAYKTNFNTYIMKKLYVTIAALACGMITFGGMNVNAQKLNRQFKISDKAFVQKKNKVRNAMPQVMKEQVNEPVPCKEVIYSFYDGWFKNSSSVMTYNEMNAMLTKKSEIFDMEGNMSFCLSDVFAYDSNGNQTEDVAQISFDEGKTWTNDQRTVTGYDIVRTDMPVMLEAYRWDSDANEWYLDEENENSYFFELERDDNNRVVKNTRWFNSLKPFAMVSQEFVYGEDGSAVKMLWNGLNDEYELVPTFIYEDMKWYKSDNQFVAIVPNVYYPFDLDRNNVVKSYKISGAAPDGTVSEFIGSYDSEFDEKGRLSYVNINFTDGSNYICDYQYDIDENGSFNVIEIVEGDLNGDGMVTDDEVEESHMYTTRDAHGEICKEEMFVVDPATKQEIMTEGYKYETEYDNDGLLTSVTSSYYTEYVDGGSYVYLDRREYSEYNGKPSGIDNVEMKNASVSINGDSMNFRNARGAHYTISDLQGKTYGHGVVRNDVVSVENLPEGMYIVKISGRNINNAVKLIKK